MRVLDVFCGAGGFSEGAKKAGAEVIMGVDSDLPALQAWAANNPDARAVHATIPSAVDWPPPAPDLHVHLSPPCQAFSNASHGSPDEAQIELFRWALNFVKPHASWSIETVPTPRARALCDEFNVQTTIVDAADLGMPQQRIRMIAGPAHLLARLRAMPSRERASTFASMPTPATHMRNTSSRREKPYVRSVHKPAYTVCASHPLTWCNADGSVVRCMTPREGAMLQGMSGDFRLPCTQRAAQRAVGNAVHVDVACAIVACAQGVDAGPCVTAAAEIPRAVEQDSTAARLICALLRELCSRDPSLAEKVLAVVGGR